MGFLDKIKKAVSGGSAPAPKTGGQGQGGTRQGSGQGGQGQGGNRQGGNRQGGNRQGGQGGNRNRGGQGGQGGQGGNRQGNRPESDGQGQGQGQGGNRRRGSRGGRGRGPQGQGGQGEQQGGTTTQERPEGGQGQGGQGAAGSNASRRRRRGGRGRGSGGGTGGSGGTRTVTRSDAAELKEQQEKSGDKPQRDRSGGQGGGGQRKRSRGGRSGGSGSGGGNRRGGRERTRRGSSSSGSQRRVLDANERPKDPVKKQILINAQDPNEIRVAIREQQQVVEVYVERKGKRSLAGNIYKGRVQNVLPGMEACFVDVGLERNGFLYVDEITPAAADSDQIMKVSMVTEVEAGAAESTDPATQAMEAAAAEHDETLEISDAMEEEDREQAEAAAAQTSSEGDADGDKPAAAKSKGRGRSRIQNKKKIQELLKQGQEILVQVVKDPMGTKGSRLTTQYSLAGRYLVYVPDGEGLGVSRRLEDAERDRLREIVKQFELPWGGGLIVRTAAEGARDEDIAKDLDLLLRLHEQLMEKAGEARAPKLLYNEADLSLRIIRDLFNGEVEEVLVDDDRQYQRITNYLKRTSPELAERVRMHDGQRPLFESYGVEEAIKSTLSKRAELPSGGYLIIDKTEAFHVIDVNSGRNVGKASLEETITKTNMEAAAEVVRQLRLRDLGGIIVIDFIDMNLMKNRDAVLEHFRTELSKDRTKTYLVEISPLGLVEMTRQNVSEGVREILTSTCRTCEGRGVQVSAETHAIEVERALVDLAAGLGDVEAVAIDAQPDVAKALAGNQGKQADLDKRTGKHIRVLPDPDLTPNTFAVRTTGTVAEVDSAPEPLVRGSKHKVLIERVDPVCEDDGIATIDGVLVTVIGAGSAVGEERTVTIAACSGSRAFATLVKPARRRRRRGGRGRRKATVGVGADGATTQLDEDAEQLDDDAGEDELDGSDEDDFEEFEDEEDASAVTLDDAPEEFDDERTEIPQRLVLLDEDEDADDDGGDDDASDDDGDDDDDEDDDDDSNGADDDADDSDSGSDDDGDDDDGDDDGSDDGVGSESGDDDSDDDSAGEDDLLDPTSISDGAPDDGEARMIVRRDVTDADRDEPSIDVDGSDDLLTERGITSAPRRTPAPSGGSRSASADDESSDRDGDSASGERADGAPRRRRRRGSRGGRGRSRSGQQRPGGTGGGTNQSQGDGSATSRSGGAGSDGPSDA